MRVISAFERHAILGVRIIMATAATVMTLAGNAQVSAPVDIEKPAFDVASVKQNKTGARADSNFPLDRSESYVPIGGVLSAKSQPLITYLIFAYKINVTETYGGLMSSLPPWAITDRFDITAKTPTPDATKDQMRSMMQSLLEDRFKLSVHRENREMSVFAMSLLKLGKAGPQLRSHVTQSSCAAELKEPPAAMSTAALVGSWPPLCGDGAQTRPASNPHHFRSGGRNMSMNAIASWLTGAGDLDLPILNRTGLTGSFDFIVEFQPDSPENVSPSLDASGPAFQDALKDQLGLQLKKQRGTVSLFIVDHVERPSAN